MARNSSTPTRRSPLDTQILRFEDLQLLSGKLRMAAVIRWAESQGIRYKYDAHGGIWTTLDALNFALGIGEDDRPYSPSEII